MDEKFRDTKDIIETMYLDGTVATEIEHLLVMRLHQNNTIQDVEKLKEKILHLMEDAYYSAKSHAESAPNF
jgi:hypothetical protein